MLYQLLGYALLDHADLYLIREAGVYCARQEKLVKWPLEGLLSTMAPPSAPALGDLRERFRAHLEQARRESPLGTSIAEELRVPPAREAPDKVTTSGKHSAERAAFERALSYMRGAETAEQPCGALRETARGLVRPPKTSLLFGRFRQRSQVHGSSPRERM